MKLHIKENIHEILNSKKDLSIESLRGIALILMVMGHVIGRNDQEGMRLEDDSFLRYIYYSLMYVRLPLFTAISGYVYSLRPLPQGSSKLFNFYKGKGRRVLFPLVFVGAIQFLFQTYTPGVNSTTELSDIWRIFIYPYSHFWYLQALFIIFILIGIMDYFGLFNKFWKWLVVLSVSIAVQQLFHFSSFFSLHRAIYLLPFFVLGCGIRRYENILRKRFVLIIASALFVLGFGFQQYAWFANLNYFNDRENIVAIFIGVFALILFFRFRFYSSFLAVVGYYSYGVFLLHLFGSASSRIFLEIINVHDPKFVIFIISLSMGIIVPIIMELFIIKSKKMRLFFLGSK